MTMPESLMRKGRRDFAESADTAKREALESIDNARDLIVAESWSDALYALSDAVHEVAQARAMRSRSDAYAQCMSWGDDE